MRDNIIREHEVAGPTKAPRPLGTGAPKSRPKKPRRSSTTSSSSSSSSSSYYAKPSRSETMIECRRRRAGPNRRAAMLLPPPGARASAAAADNADGSRSRPGAGVDVQAQAWRGHPVPVLERLETALRPDLTTIANSVMEVLSLRTRNDIKQLLLETTHRKVRIYVDKDTFILRPPKQRRRRRGLAAAPQPQPATKATQTGKTATDKIARKVNVVLTPANAVRPHVSGMLPRPPRCPPPYSVCVCVAQQGGTGDPAGAKAVCSTSPQALCTPSLTGTPQIQVERIAAPTLDSPGPCSAQSASGSRGARSSAFTGGGSPGSRRSDCVSGMVSQRGHREAVAQRSDPHRRAKSGMSDSNYEAPGSDQTSCPAYDEI